MQAIRHCGIADPSCSDRCTAQALREKIDAERLAAGLGPTCKRRDKKPLVEEDWEPYLCDFWGNSQEPRMPSGDGLCWRRCCRRLDKEGLKRFAKPSTKPSDLPRCPYMYLPEDTNYFNILRKGPGGLSQLCRMCNRVTCAQGNAAKAEAKAKAEAEAEAEAEQEEG